MSDNFRGWLGKDGKRYNDWLEKLNADAVVENSIRQTELLQAQAEMQVLQAKQREQEMLQRQEQEEERQEHEKEMEKQRYEHDKEMRILKMFDNISIPYEIFQKFKQQLFKQAETSEEDNKKLLEIMAKDMDRMNNNSRQKDEILAMIKGNTDIAVCNQQVKYTKKYEVFEKFINNTINLKDISKEDFKLINNDKDITAILKEIKVLRMCKPIYLLAEIPLVIIAIVSLLMIFSKGSSLIGCITLSLIFGGMALCLNVATKVKPRIIKLKQVINAEVNAQIAEEERKRLSTQAEIENDLPEEMEQIQNKYEQITIELIKNKIEYLYDFRINHYNMQIEKIFYDSGLVKQCMENNVAFKDINKSNIIAEGTFEDYFHFFNNFEQGFNEYSNTNKALSN